MDERIIELETRVAYQDKLINDLDDVVRLFTARIERLERRVGELGSELLEARGDAGPANERPPHY